MSINLNKNKILKHFTSKICDLIEKSFFKILVVLYLYI